MHSLNIIGKNTKKRRKIMSSLWIETTKNEINLKSLEKNHFLSNEFQSAFCHIDQNTK